MTSEPEGTELRADACPVAERLAGELFTLLVHPTVAAGDFDDVVEALRKVSAVSH
jgi:dTDP-4-amino-4,6-dideoxygalactose transaminase